jgi:hypothetical protein
MPVAENTISSWTPGMLVRFIQNMLREHPPEFSSNFSADNITVNKTMKCLDQLQFNSFQTTVGSAGGASPLPATPKGYFKVLDYTGNTVLVPFYPTT